jgi:hypothetical protein
MHSFLIMHFCQPISTANNPNAFFSRMDNGKQSQYGRKDKPTCSHCGYKGHTAENAISFMDTLLVFKARISSTCC